MSYEKDLMLPVGYGVGTIIYDNFNTPHEAVENLQTGANMYKVVEVEKDYAIKRIEQGSKVLVSNQVI